MIPARKRTPAAPGPIADLTLNAALVLEILSGFIAAETSRTGRRRVVVGLSGGLDSAVSATLNGSLASRNFAITSPRLAPKATSTV